MARRVALVPHTHWDREWYAGFQSFRFRLVAVFDDLLERLESDPTQGQFLLDGQMAVVDDYLEMRPANRERLQALAGAGRVTLGPWYVLMDEFLVSGETIIRNLQLGTARAKTFGAPLPVGYLPDMFGHIAQMPQLLRQAGIDHAVVWRGVPAAVTRTGFWWRAPDGSTVRAEYLPTGYSNGASIPDDPEALMRRLRAHEAELGPFLGASTTMLVMNGTDHQAPQPWVPALVETLNREQADFELALVPLADYLEAAPTEALPSWRGELRSGARANLLMGVLSNRLDIKAAAAVAERSLERRAEPLAALWLPPERWPQALLDEAWLQMIRNSAHDSICACSADEVGLAVRHRYAEATAIATEVVADVHRHLADDFAVAGPVVVNPNPRALSGLVELVIAGEVAPPRTQVLEATPAGTLRREATGRDLARILAELTVAGWLDDGRGTAAEVFWAPDGIDLDIVLDRAAGADRSLRPVDAAMAEAAAQAGANPDGPLRLRVDRRACVRLLARVDDVPGYGWATPTATAPAPPATWPSAGPEATADAVGPTPLRGSDNWLDNGLVHLAVSPADGTFAINGLGGLDRLVNGGDDGDTYTYSPPAEDHEVHRPESTEVTLLEEGPLRGRLRVRRRFVWPSRLRDGHRVGQDKVEVTTVLELRAGEPLVRIETSFDNRCRDHRLRSLFPLPWRVDHSEAECAFALVHRGLEAAGGPGEVGLATFPSRRFVRAGGLTLTHEGLPEYELTDGGWSLALTLLRSTGVLSAPAPAYRPNAAGPAQPLDGPQLLGPVRARYAVTLEAVDPWQLADLAWIPLEVVHARGSGTRPASGSHLRVCGAEVSSLRRVGAALELRVFNPSDDATTVRIPGRSGRLVDLLGRGEEPWDGTFALRPWAIATARIDPPPPAST